VTTAIIVLNFNGTEDTLACLQSLRAITFRDTRVYVVDNGSQPPLKPSLPREDRDVRLLESPVNLGFTGGCNLAARAALDDGASHLLFLNNDAVVAPGFLEPLVRAVDDDPQVGIATPKIYFHGQDRVIWAHGASLNLWTGRSLHLGVYRQDTGQFDHVRTVDRVTGCAMLVRRDFVERVGMLDDRFFAYGEEMDWCLRARKQGFRMAVVPESVVWHKGHRTSGKIGRPFIDYLRTRNHLLLLRKNSDSFALRGLVARAVFLTSLTLRSMGLALRGRRASARAVLRGFRDARHGRFGPPPTDL
jgi:GT2 family glycosyltransferase